MSDVSVSVIIPCFNCGHHLRRAVESALAQTHTALEVIVVDDGSSDGSVARLQPTPKLRIIRQPNQGVSAARNAGVAVSRGRHLQFLDGDDVIFPDKLATQLAVLEAHPDAAVAYSEVLLCHGDDENRTSRETWRVYRLWEDAVQAFAVSNVIAMHSALMRRETFDAVGGFDALGYRGEDWVFWMKVALSGARFTFVPGVAGLYRVHGGGITQDWLRNLRWETRVVLSFKEMFNARAITSAERWHALALGIARRAQRWALMGDVDEARRLLNETEGAMRASGEGIELFVVPEGRAPMKCLWLGVAGDLLRAGMEADARHVLARAECTPDFDAALFASHVNDDVRHAYARAFEAVGETARAQRLRAATRSRDQLPVRPCVHLAVESLRERRVLDALRFGVRGLKRARSRVW